MTSRSVLRAVVVALTLCVGIPASYGDDRSALDKELDKVWGKERDIKVIEKRLFEKDARWEFTPYFGFIPNDEFFNYYPLGGRINYFFTETIGVEAFGAYTIPQDSGLQATVEQFQGINQAQPLRKLQWYAGAAAYWAPIHGKISAFSQKLIHFDGALTLGFGALGTKKLGGGTEKSKIDPMAQVGVGFNAYFTYWLSVRVDYRNYFYWISERGRVSYPAEVTFGVGFWTAAPR